MFYPYKLGGVKKVLAMLNGGGGTISLGAVWTQLLDDLAILKGGTTSFHLKWGGKKGFTLRAVQKVSDP